MNTSNASVVIVDDEEMVITSLRAFLQLETEYQVHCFTEPEEAAKFLETNTVDICVSDYLMPRMNGIQFLSRAKQLQPEASRVLLTGHADKQSAIAAINQVALFQYVEKPWDNAQLLLVIQSGVERAQLFRTLREKVSELDTAHSSLKEVQRRLLQAFM
jgi:DNA-binding NtrC family response regulator